MSLSATIECAQKREVEGQWEEDSTDLITGSQRQPKTAKASLFGIDSLLVAHWQSENLIQNDQNFDLNRSE